MLRIRETGGRRKAPALLVVAAQAFFCDTFVGARVRYQDRTGTLRPQGRQNHDGLCPPNRGGKGVRSPRDGLKSNSGKGSYMDLHKRPGYIAEVPISS